jgi:hypothetical protein
MNALKMNEKLITRLIKDAYIEMGTRKGEVVEAISIGNPII